MIIKGCLYKAQDLGLSHLQLFRCPWARHLHTVCSSVATHSLTVEDFSLYWATPRWTEFLMCMKWTLWMYARVLMYKRPVVPWINKDCDNVEVEVIIIITYQFHHPTQWEQGSWAPELPFCTSGYKKLYYNLRKFLFLFQELKNSRFSIISLYLTKPETVWQCFNLPVLRKG